jgi:hypothetical protein
MTEPELTDTDAALRERLTELCVHIPCGGIRGPLQQKSRYHPWLPVQWQSCRDEDSPQKWPGCDVSEEYALCIVCFRGTAGGRSRWAWLACEDCLSINGALEELWGFRPLALGRHSLMNGIGIRSGSPPDVVAEQTLRLTKFAKGHTNLREWRAAEYPRLAAPFDPLADVPLREWQQQWPPSRRASVAAFSGVLDLELPLRPPR